VLGNWNDPERPGAYDRAQLEVSDWCFPVYRNVVRVRVKNLSFFSFFFFGNKRRWKRRRKRRRRRFTW